MSPPPQIIELTTAMHDTCAFPSAYTTVMLMNSQVYSKKALQEPVQAPRRLISRLIKFKQKLGRYLLTYDLPFPRLKH